MPHDLTKTETDALPDDIKAILARAKAKKMRFQRDASLIWIPCLFVFGFSAWLMRIEDQLLSFPVFLFASFIALLPYALYLYSKWAKGAYRLHADEMERLSKRSEVRFIGTILDSTDNVLLKDFNSHEAILLKKLLPLLTPSESHTLSPNQKEKLSYCLYSRDKDLKLKAITALKNVGDRNTLQFLKRSSWSNFLSGRDREISQALEDCIVHLEQHLSSKEIESQLLRPAPSSAQSDLLLRPATQKPDEDTNTLLLAEIGEKTD